MVHVPELLGCTASGPSTEDALAITPDAIRAFLQFLHTHGEPVNLSDEIELELVEHVMEGVWLGNGDPSVVFAPDLDPLSEADVDQYTRWLSWMGADLRELILPLGENELQEPPAPKGRSIQAILEHILEAEYAYIYAYGRIDGLPASGSIISKRTGPLLDWIDFVRAREIERLKSLSEVERNTPFIHWKYTRTGHKVLRRMLEHLWEHLVEIKTRLS